MTLSSRPSPHLDEPNLPASQSAVSRRTFAWQSAAWLSGWMAGPVLAQVQQNATAASSAPGSPAFNPLLAQNAPAQLDPANYLVSEKLDGVRALWDGAALRFRSGRTVAAPSWFTAKLPTTPLDGELWLARGKFDVLSGMVRKAQPQDADWQQIKYMVFELPAGTDSFEQRAAQLSSIVARAAWPQLQAVAQFRLANAAALQAKLKAVVAQGGEGLMLHLANAPVTSGRNAVLLKVKPVQDAEATVVGYIAGKGKYQGMLGALEVQSASGQRFKLGSGLSDAQRANPPAIGTVVTYTYNDTTPSGKPRFARFLRLYQE